MLKTGGPSWTTFSPGEGGAVMATMIPTTAASDSTAATASVSAGGTL